MKAMHTWTSVAALLAVAWVPVLSGCGTPAAPQPPSLNLPQPVTDLTATRAGDQVTLTWTMPRKTSDKLLLKTSIPVRVCRKDVAATCTPIPNNLLLAPGSGGAFTDALPPALLAGAPRSLTYFVELTNHKGRSAGQSNAAVVLAGEAPAPVAGLTAQVRKEGIVLHWTPDGEHTAVRLHRKLLTSQPNASAAKPKSEQGLFTAPPEPTETSLLVDAGAQSGKALDKEIRFGQSYEYRAQRVALVSVGDQTLELAGELSAPVRVEAVDIFPPDVPSGLAAVATASDATTPASIDLSWQPVTDTDLAGYAIYRRDPAEPNKTWQRISPPQPVVGPAFHDAQVQPGHTYRYAVSAIDQGGHESARSAEASETVPNP